MWKPKSSKRIPKLIMKGQKWSSAIGNRLVDRIGIYWYRFKCLIRPFNHLRITTLPRTYTDRDNLYIHASFQVLCDFIEKEVWPVFACNWAREQMIKRNLPISVQFNQQLCMEYLRLNDDGNCYGEMAELYEWWQDRITRPRRCKMFISNTQHVLPMDNKPWPLEQEVGFHLRSYNDNFWFQMEQKQLERLTKIRNNLWI